MAIVYICYEHFNVTINGLGYGFMQVPRNIFNELGQEAQLEVMFLEAAYVRTRYEYEEAVRQAREAERIRRLAEQERIIGFAMTMSTILHRKEEMRKKQANEGSSSS
ncbi:hypothetical protein POM88_021280 [Heracleum sosnowskyi]|uniref:Uncharacterized protein n=1 Tax=Heracleum sosnowskyi TaxID=360622 RepID=A0AAD8IGL1_9APIA|nr:hypothetical protein POM88_021280 [Heracleum sosnowskyi]